MTVQREVPQEVNRVLQVVFQSWHKTGRMELEPIEMLVRDAMHRAGAATVQRLLWPARPSRPEGYLPLRPGSALSRVPP
jgi:hypothetical protein